MKTFATKHKKLLITLSIILLLVLAGFSPAFQGTQRFREIITQTLNVTTSATIQDATLDDPVLTDATITGVTLAGTVTSNSPINNTAGGSYAPNMVVAAPTGVGTATPVIMANTAGGLSNLAEFRAASTPQVIVGPGGALTANQLTTLNGGSVNNVNQVVAGPTALATATPVLYVNSASAHNLVVVSKAATPVFIIGNDGTIVTGQVIKNTAGYEETCGVQTVTGAATTTAHGLSTPVAVNVQLATDPVGDQIVSYTNSAAVITLKVWSSVAGTPVASTDAVSVAWCAKGTP